MKTKLIVIALTLLFFASLFYFGAQYYRDSEAKKIGFMAKENAHLFVREHSPTMGPDDAKVYLVEFMDPECETCGMFYPFVKSLLAENPGKIKLVIRYVPNHRNSKLVIRILEAARLQGKYWETLALLFKNLPKWGSHHHPQPELIWTYLPEVGVDVEKVRAELNNPKISKIIEQDIADAQALGVRKTPGFFINGNPLRRFGYAQLREAIQLELAK